MDACIYIWCIHTVLYVLKYVLALNKNNVSFLVVEGLEKSREPLRTLEAIYIMTPTKEVFSWY